MEHLSETPSPDATTLAKHVGSIIFRSRWLIVIASLLVSGLTLAFYRSGDVEAWSGRTIVRVGLVPSSDHLLRDRDLPLVPIESPTSLVARISDPIFQNRVISNTKFEAANAAASRKLAASSLRAVTLAIERDVAVEVSASSSADVDAVFRSLANEISSAHGAIMQRRLDILRSNLTELQNRVDFLEKSMIGSDPRLLGTGREGQDQAGPSIVVQNSTGIADIWNKLKDQIHRDSNLLELTEQTVSHIEPGTYPQSQRSIRPGRAAISAGFAMLAAMIVLAILTAPRRRSN